ncbi:MAG TPA: hypothetical protein VGA55_00215 [Bacteroidota bacterium]
MPGLTGSDVRDVVAKALREVADWSGNIDELGFTKFTDFHKQVFINAIALHLAYQGYSVTLSRTKLSEFKKMKELIAYIEDRRVYDGPPLGKIGL